MESFKLFKKSRSVLELDGADLRLRSFFEASPASPNLKVRHALSPDPGFTQSEWKTNLIPCALSGHTRRRARFCMHSAQEMSTCSFEGCIASERRVGVHASCAGDAGMSGSISAAALRGTLYRLLPLPAFSPHVSSYFYALC